MKDFRQWIALVSISCYSILVGIVGYALDLNHSLRCILKIFHRFFVNKEALLTNRTVSVLWEALPRILTAGLTMTIPLTLISFSLAMVIAVAVALVQYANVPVLRQIARFYIWVIRGTPLLVQLFIIFYGLPSLGIMLDAFPAAVIAFAFNEGAYCAETMRGALESVPQGQLEAGSCVGMTWWQIMRRIVLPQCPPCPTPSSA